jgi:hypothetical protein
MKEQELNKLLDKAIGTKGNLQIHSYWMNKTLKGIIEYNKTLIPSIPTKISYFDNDIGYVDHNYVEPIIKTINTELGIYNGVYAVTPDMDLVNYENADYKCIGVAVITDEFKIMINKHWIESSTWASNLSNYNIAGITDCSTITKVSNDLDGENNTKYLK